MGFHGASPDYRKRPRRRKRPLFSRKKSASGVPEMAFREDGELEGENPLEEEQDEPSVPPLLVSAPLQH